MSKKLFVLISDEGDGSYSPSYTMNEDFITYMERRDSKGELDCSELGCDGDGFHYDTLTVPDDVTLKTLGVDDVAESYPFCDKNFDSDE